MPELKKTYLQTQSTLVIGHQGVPQPLPRALSADLGIAHGPFPERCFTGTIAIKNIFHPKLYSTSSGWYHKNYVLAYGQYYGSDKVVDRCAPHRRLLSLWYSPLQKGMQIKPPVSQLHSPALLWQPTPSRRQSLPDKGQQLCTLLVHKVWHCAQGWWFIWQFWGCISFLIVQRLFTFQAKVVW